MNIFKRIFQPTPENDKIKGKISTLISGGCVYFLSSGYIVDPKYLIGLSLVGLVFGGKAFLHAIKVKPNPPKDEN